MRDWIDRLSFRARVTIIIGVFVTTMLAVMDDPVQLLGEVGKDLFEIAVAATSW